MKPIDIFNRIKHFIIYFYKHTIFSLIELIKKFKLNNKKIKKWINKGRIFPPPHIIKQKIVKMYAKHFGIEIFIETGTGNGSMVKKIRKFFKKIHSIELSTTLYNIAKERLSKYEHVKLYYGNSSKVLPVIVKNIKKPCLFWLDAHFSGGKTARGDLITPIRQELSTILEFSNKNSVILIDDANSFDANRNYPTLNELLKQIKEKWLNISFIVKENIIRIFNKTYNN